MWPIFLSSKLAIWIIQIQTDLQARDNGKLVHILPVEVFSCCQQRRV